jgi:hypothetical protein
MRSLLITTKILHIVTIWTEYELLNGVIDHLYKSLGTTSNYSANSNLHTKNHSALSSQSAFTSRCLVTALNNGYFSASCSSPVQN